MPALETPGGPWRNHATGAAQIEYIGGENARGGRGLRGCKLADLSCKSKEGEKLNTRYTPTGSRKSSVQVGQAPFTERKWQPQSRLIEERGPKWEAYSPPPVFCRCCS